MVKINRSALKELYSLQSTRQSNLWQLESLNVKFNIKMRQMLKSTERYHRGDLNHLHSALVLPIYNDNL